MRALVVLAVLLSAGCQADKPLYDQLQRMQAASDPARVVAERIACPDKSAICERLLLEHGAACLRLSESAEPARRAAMRRCALDDFTAARRQLPPDAGAESKSAAACGLVEALIVQRDNTFDAKERAGATAKLDALAGELHGTPEGAYAAANNALNRVLTGEVPQAQACAVMAAARAGLDAAPASGELAARIDHVRADIDFASRDQVPSCTH
jgi:hypothetical protein